jgi:hypothetical protein
MTRVLLSTQHSDVSLSGFDQGNMSSVSGHSNCSRGACMVRLLNLQRLAGICHTFWLIFQYETSRSTMFSILRFEFRPDYPKERARGGAEVGAWMLFDNLLHSDELIHFSYIMTPRFPVILLPRMPYR